MPYEDVRVNVVETGALGINEPTHGSRAPPSPAARRRCVATEQAIAEMCRRAAAEWGIDPEAVEWNDGAAQPAGPNAGKFPPMSIAEIAGKMSDTGGPIAGH